MNHYCCAISYMQTHRARDVRKRYALAHNPTEPTEHREASTKDTAPDEQRKERICRCQRPSLRKQSCDIGTGTCDKFANRRSGCPFCNSNEQSRIHVINPPSFCDCFCCAARDLNPIQPETAVLPRKPTAGRISKPRIYKTVHARLDHSPSADRSLLSKRQCFLSSWIIRPVVTVKIIIDAIKR